LSLGSGSFCDYAKLLHECELIGVGSGLNELAVFDLTYCTPTDADLPVGGCDAVKFASMRRGTTPAAYNVITACYDLIDFKMPESNGPSANVLSKTPIPPVGVVPRKIGLPVPSFLKVRMEFPAGCCSPAK
jgi:hypothetical protein